MATCLGKSCSFVLMRVFRDRIFICVCFFSFFGFEGGMWELIVLVPDH